MGKVGKIVIIHFYEIIRLLIIFHFFINFDKNSKKFQKVSNFLKIANLNDYCKNFFKMIPSPGC